MERFFKTYRRELWVCLLLAAAVMGLYAPARTYEFVNFDDTMNVSENPYILQGLTPESVRYALTSREDYWRPLTRLSHLLDVEWFGLDAGAHRRTNVILHAANALLLFGVLRRMTGSVWRSAFVAAVFALHPLRVESVAWVTERKDVLSALFWMLTLWTYAAYTEKPSVLRYSALLASFLLGLMAKPMLITLPFALLLLDFWPLRRMGAWGMEHGVENRGQRAEGRGRKSSILTHHSPLATRHLILEKIPLFVLAFISLGWTVVSQRLEGIAVDTSIIPFASRIGNALISYATYPVMMIRPVGLAVLYPHIFPMPVDKAVLAGAVLLIVTVAVLWKTRRHPYLFAGWFWYVGTLVPTAGLVQVGDQRMADRFTYLPMIGLLVAVTWGVCELTSRRRDMKGILVAAAVAVLAACAWGTARLLPVWQNSITLFENALRTGNEGVIAHNNIGNALMDRGRNQEAVPHLLSALQINPSYAKSHNNMGIALARLKRYGESLHHYQEALRIQPVYDKAHCNFGFLLSEMGRYKEAEEHCREAIRISPGYAEAHSNLGLALTRQNRLDEAIVCFREAVRLKPDNAAMRQNLEAVTSALNRQRRTGPATGTAK